jgi:hypothetical protein
LVDRYFQSLLNLLSASPVVRSSDITLDTRREFVGFIRRNIYFTDDSMLHFRELVDVALAVDKVVYAYHYQNVDGRMFFRYDNTPHFPQLPNAPHHKHAADETNVISVFIPDLAIVLTEIEAMVPVE